MARPRPDGLRVAAARDRARAYRHLRLAPHSENETDQTLGVDAPRLCGVAYSHTYQPNDLLFVRPFGMRAQRIIGAALIAGSFAVIPFARDIPLGWAFLVLALGLSGVVLFVRRPQDSSLNVHSIDPRDRGDIT